MDLKNRNLYTISNYLNKELKDKDRVSIIVKNPDKFLDAISLKSWLDLAQILYCKLLIPKIINEYEIEITFEKLNKKNSFHNEKIADIKEKYGINSKFFKINKLNQSSFLIHYIKALKSVKIEEKTSILNLGINKADEFEAIKYILDEEILKKIEFIGVDHSKSSINFAKNRFKEKNFNFFVADINTLDNLNLTKADLIISIGTLQSTTINYKPLLMKLVQNYLSSKGALILGFPNSRWIDNELIYGAKAPNYNYSEMSILFNDIIFTKKYLQQKKFRVTITGKDYIFITATKIG